MAEELSIQFLKWLGRYVEEIVVMRAELRSISKMIDNYMQLEHCSDEDWMSFLNSVKYFIESRLYCGDGGLKSGDVDGFGNIRVEGTISRDNGYVIEQSHLERGKPFIDLESDLMGRLNEGCDDIDVRVTVMEKEVNNLGSALKNESTVTVIELNPTEEAINIEANVVPHL
ncbi:hypothetical protein TorRG33x02_344580 [Trema orientale]|uniref:Uncharacterized protein n=1 Tax=Trema orientale TaxID=63057 RepID=A0A2P5APZ6_TREOI|nr:hypothetical protein TorRG33x02_344580 [Trema orientale]